MTHLVSRSNLYPSKNSVIGTIRAPFHSQAGEAQCRSRPSALIVLSQARQALVSSGSRAWRCYMRGNLVRIGVAGLWLICALPQSAIVAEGRPPATAAEVAHPPVSWPAGQRPATGK